MKKFLDKETVIVLVVAAILLIVWGFWYPKYQRQQQMLRDEQLKEIAAAKAAQQAAQQKMAPVVQKKIETPKKTTVKNKSLPSAPLKKQAAITLSNKLASFVIDPMTGSVVRVELSQYKTSDRKAQIAFDSAKGMYGTAAVTGLNGWTLADVRQEKTDLSLKLSRTFVNGKERLNIIQSFRLPADSYKLQMKMVLSNESGTQVVIPELKVWTMGIPPMQYFGGDKLYSPMHRIDYCPHVNKTMVSVDPSAKEEKFKKAETTQAVDWVGSTNKYFASLLFSDPAFDGGTAVERMPHQIPGGKEGEFYYVPSIAGIFRNLVVSSGTSKEITMDYFAGPKTLTEVKKLPESALPILHISMFSWMEFLARPVLSLLNILKDWTGSYGVAIILLTLIVRIVFFPLTERGNRSMRKMAKIAPKAKEIREKYKDNPQLMNQKTMDLYREEKVSPLGGCLPILIQIPIFFALYAALDSAVELRHVSFLWATDLTKPDLVGSAFFFGYGIHPLVLVMTALMVLQQKMTPSNMDPAQQKMMMLMPMIMLVILYNLPSGLTLYWTVSQIFSILQMKYSSFAAKREEEKASLAHKP